MIETGVTKKAVTGAILVLAIAFGMWVILSRDDGAMKNKKDEILEISKRGNVSDIDKKRLFELLSGEQYKEYKFSEKERAVILKAIGG
jgi:hypothetical protein